MSSIWDHEFNYAELICLAGFERDAIVNIEDIIEGLENKGLVTVEKGPTPGNVPSYLRANPDGTHTIVLHPDTKDSRKKKGNKLARWSKCHESSEWKLRVYKDFDPYFERAVNELSGYVMAPKQKLMEVVRRSYPMNFARLAWAFKIKMFEAACRVSQSTGMPVCSVRSSEILVGGDHFDWGSEAQIRDWAREAREGTLVNAPVHGVVAVDEPGLVILWVE